MKTCMFEESFIPPEHVTMLYDPPVPTEFGNVSLTTIYGYKPLGDLVNRLKEVFEEEGLPTKIDCTKTTGFGMEALKYLLAEQGKSLYFDESRRYAVIEQS